MDGKSFPFSTEFHFPPKKTNSVPVISDQNTNLQPIIKCDPNI